MTGVRGSECQRGAEQVPLPHQGHDPHERLRGRGGRGLPRGGGGGTSQDCDIYLTAAIAK